MALNNTLDQMDLSDTYRTFHPKEAKCTFFSNANGKFSKIDHMLGHKTTLNKFKKVEIISSIFSDYNAMKREINHKKKTKKYTKTWKLNNMLKNNKWVNNEIKKEMKNTLKQMNMRTQQSKICGTLGKQS